MRVREEEGGKRAATSWAHMCQPANAAVLRSRAAACCTPCTLPLLPHALHTTTRPAHAANPCRDAAVPALLAAAICHGAYPWEASAATAEPATAVGAAAATREQLVTRLRTQANEMRRAEEELALLAEERLRCIHYLNVRLSEIGAALVRCQERSAAGLAGSPVPPCRAGTHACVPARM